MSTLWLIVSFWAGAASCWYLSSWLMKKFFKESLMVDTIKNLKTETVLKLRDEAEKEIERRKGLLGKESRA